MSLYEMGNVWWSRVELNGEILQRSTKCRSKELASVGSRSASS
jgi:hypothetical protein